MKSTKLITILLAVFIATACLESYGQDTNTDNHTITVTIPSVALLDLETSGTRNFTAAFTAPTEAGDNLTAPSDNTDLWLNYTSVITGTATKKVTATLSELVDGVDIKLAVASSSTGSGDKGTPIGSATTLSTSATDVITAIGSAYTVSGASSGHQLTYSFVAEDANFADLASGSTTVTVTYTMIAE
ncbi:hypothetical protein LAG90_11655 [Marinilongibacter aquaticus]|uniref:hypothetical protein n=1 Tax=Marinilongibacter aquaticus TaxID=2975157 RepID=UPI0021BD8D1D|nr:hypothetical protein [Marinilongibacter aquaticus]UBM57474.1 hypothetical protein LAG90_11655 [Marinilongibacter aquaticus]